jgi:SAM-dependent methyltransferase
MAVPGVHEKFFDFFLRGAGPARPQRVLDLGAGQGALAQRLREAGFEVSACDSAPENFRVAGIECRRVDLAGALPYAAASFEALVGVELTEHLADHSGFFSECARVLAPGGKLFLSTPNVLSLKSRLRYLLTGFHYSFDPLDPARHDGLQHVTARTLDQYDYLARRQGLRLVEMGCDIPQYSSLALLWLWPLLWLSSLYLRTDFRRHNSLTLLVGRKLFAVFEKPRA